jgi:hypothetical protein
VGLVGGGGRWLVVVALLALLRTAGPWDALAELLSNPP